MGVSLWEAIILSPAPNPSGVRSGIGWDPWCYLTPQNHKYRGEHRLWNASPLPVCSLFKHLSYNTLSSALSPLFSYFSDSHSSFAKLPYSLPTSFFCPPLLYQPLNIFNLLSSSLICYTIHPMLTFIISPYRPLPSVLLLSACLTNGFKEPLSPLFSISIARTLYASTLESMCWLCTDLMNDPLNLDECLSGRTFMVKTSKAMYCVLHLKWDMILMFYMNQRKLWDLVGSLAWTTCHACVANWERVTSVGCQQGTMTRCHIDWSPWHWNR